MDFFPASPARGVFPSQNHRLPTFTESFLYELKHCIQISLRYLCITFQNRGMTFLLVQARYLCKCKELLTGEGALEQHHLRAWLLLTCRQ